MSGKEYTVYDEVLNYLLSEGYTEEESNLIMVELINEDKLSSLVKGIRGIAKFVQKRASTPLKTAATDASTAALLVPQSAPTVAGKITTAAVSSPTPIIRTVKSPSVRTAPKGANKLTGDVWAGPTPPKTVTKPTSKVPTVSSQPQLPPGKTGGPLATTRAPKPQFKPEALPKPKATAEPGGPLATTRAPKPQFKPEALPKPKATAEPGGALVRTRAPKPEFKPEALPSAKSTLWSKVQQVTQPQKQLPAAKQTQPSDSQLWKKLNKTAERSVDYQASQKPAPAPQWKVAPKGPSEKAVSKEIKSPGGRPRPKVSDLAKYAAPLATAAALSQLKGDTEKRKTKVDKPKSEQGVGVIPRVAKPYVPERPKGTEIPKNPPVKEKPESASYSGSKPNEVLKSKITPKVKAASKPPVDPEVERYNELKKTDPVKAKALGMKIWTKKYKPAFSQPDIA